MYLILFKLQLIFIILSVNKLQAQVKNRGKNLMFPTPTPTSDPKAS